jgi:phage shock protein PspC (stress-responsive transcriptional regulator)
MMRDMTNKKIAGVCAGIARHMDWDVTLIRVAFIAAILFKGLGLIAYLIAWIAMPRDDLRTVSPAQ